MKEVDLIIEDLRLKKGINENTNDTARRLAYGKYGMKKVCSKCGSKKNVEIHHKDGDESNNEKSNLQPLCKSCHIEGRDE